MYDASPNIAECYKCNYSVCEWWGILQVGLYISFSPTHVYISVHALSGNYIIDEVDIY